MAEQRQMVSTGRYVYVEQTPNGTFRKEMTEEEYEKLRHLSFAERKALINPNNEVTE